MYLNNLGCITHNSQSNISLNLKQFPIPIYKQFHRDSIVVNSQCFKSCFPKHSFSVLFLFQIITADRKSIRDINTINNKIKTEIGKLVAKSLV